MISNLQTQGLVFPRSAAHVITVRWENIRDPSGLERCSEIGVNRSPNAQFYFEDGGASSDSPARREVGPQDAFVCES